MAALRFSASSAARLSACPGSADLERAIPGYVPPVVDDTKGAKGRGTSVHAILEQTADMTHAELVAMAKILQYVAGIKANKRLTAQAELSMTADWLQTKPKTQVDLVLYNQSTLHVIDYKWGRIPVDVTDNEQLLYYAICAAPLAPAAKGVTLHILQPLANNMESQFVSTTELIAWKAKFQAAEKRILDGDLTLQPNDHCTFCPANPHSRGDKGSPLCPQMMQLLYPSVVDTDAILGLV